MERLTLGAFGDLRDAFFVLMSVILCLSFSFFSFSFLSKAVYWSTCAWSFCIDLPTPVAGGGGGMTAASFGVFESIAVSILAP